MKKLITLYIIGIFAAALLTQTPQKMSSRAVVHNSSGELVAGSDTNLNACAQITNSAAVSMAVVPDNRPVVATQRFSI
jgi:hypothetical protein